MTRITTAVKCVAIITAFVGAIVFLLPFADADAQESRIIRIWGRAEPWIEPPIVMVSKGTTVIWFNNSKDEVQIVFEEGKKCEDVTDAATSFTMDTKSCYVTTWLPFGATSSLRFNEPGVFEYIVAYSGRNQKDRGRIVVE